MHSKGGRASCLWLLETPLSAGTRADIIEFLVCVFSWSPHATSSGREKQFAERKCCVSRWCMRFGAWVTRSCLCERLHLPLTDCSPHTRLIRCFHRTRRPQGALRGALLY